MIKLLQHSLICFVGGSPVLAIALNACGILPLKWTALFIVLPAWVCLYFYFYRTNKTHTFCKYWSAGVIAVLLYDLSRIPFVYFGWDDFIPKIGFALGFEGDYAVFFGYAWRYIFNGGGLAIAFYGLQRIFPALKSEKLFTGMAYGVLIWLCLDIVLFFAGTDAMFPPTPFNIIGSYVGHVVYGLSLVAVLRMNFLSFQPELSVEKVP